MKNSIKRSLTFLVLLVISNASMAQTSADTSASQKLTLEQVWEKAEAYNKTLQMKRLEVRRSEEEVKDAKSERLPEVSASTSYSRVSNMPIYENGLFNKPVSPEIEHNLFNVNGEAYLNLYNGHKARTKIEVEELKHSMVLEQQNMTASEIKYRSTALFLNLEQNLIFKDLVNKNIEERNQELQQIRQLHKNGVVLRSDLLRTELQLSKQKMALVEIENNILLARQKLNIMIGQEEDTQIIPQEMSDANGTDKKTYEDLLAAAENHSFQLHLSEKETELSKLRLKDVKANGSPKVGLFAEYGLSYPQIFLYPYALSFYGLGQAGVKISLPVSALYQNKHKKNAAAMEAQMKEVENSNTQDQIRQDVKEAYVRFKESLTRIDVAEANIKQATESARIIQNSYFNQLSLLTDLLDADTQLLQARFDLASAQIASRLQYFQLQKTIGTL